MTLKEIRDNARERMKGFCRVCPRCDGRACAGEVPGMGGLGSGASFQDNVSSLAEYGLQMHLVHDCRNPQTGINLLGFELDMPLLAAPIGGISFNMGGYLGEADYALAVAKGCRNSGILPCMGDGVPIEVLQSGLQALAQVDAIGIPFVKPWDGDELFQKMDLVADAGCKAIGMDIDAAGLVTLARMGRPVGPKTLPSLKGIVEKAHSRGMSFVVKGILSLRDAELAVAAGCDALLISNHGGRVLEQAVGTARFLAAAGNQLARLGVPVLVDGGIRSGGDIFKMLALGADAVLIGRPISIAAIGGGDKGVTEYVNSIRNELVQAMIMTGCSSIADIRKQGVLCKR